MVVLSLAVTTAGPGSAIADAWAWPLSPLPAVQRRFDGPPAPWAPGHRGVDLQASPRQPVLAPAAGTVVFSGIVVDRGVITIDHGNGLRSSFEPVMNSLPLGSVVSKSQQIAVLGNGTHCPSACLHWGVRRDSLYVDPLGFLSRRFAVLLPDGRE